MVMMLRLGINYVLSWTKDVAVERTKTTELHDAAEACATVQVWRTALESACAQHSTEEGGKHAIQRSRGDEKEASVRRR